MKKIIIGFIAGIIVASGAWCAYVYFLESTQALEYCAFFTGEAQFAEKLIHQAESPSPENRRKAMRTGVNIIKTWLMDIDSTDEQYPFLKVRERVDEEYNHAQALVEEYEKKISNNQLESIATNAANPQL